MRSDTYLEDVGDGIFTIDLFLHDTILVDANCGKNIQDSLVHRLKTIDDERDSDLLPSGDAFFCTPTPVLGLLGLADVTDIQHDTMESASIEGLVFVVRRDGDQ